MENIFLGDAQQLIIDMFYRFIGAYQRIYEGLVDEKMWPEIVGLDWAIVLSSVGFVLFFLREEVLGIFGFYTKAHAERDRLERIKFFIEHEDENEEADEENKKNKDNDITIGRR